MTPVLLQTRENALKTPIVKEPMSDVTKLEINDVYAVTGSRVRWTQVAKRYVPLHVVNINHWRNQWIAT